LAVLEVSKRFFFEKKKQKTSAHWPRWRRATEANEQKFFGYFFSKK
jgi:hypothetical protein